MRTITIRQLQQNIYKELKDLPVVVTIKGENKYIINVATIDTPNVATIIKNEAKNVATSISPVQNRTQNVATYFPHKKCAVSFCREDATASGKLYNETTGEVELVLMCKNHAFKSLREYA